ncbi:GntR family transcriptional regulator [Dethiosulfatibacter aminovorans]|uniref:GntR family transcriptional regulator n=1 Tax=Dethiosulfatibacter aminovorans TaxID=332095 RepID=UPI001FEA787A|nr:GntR family transcriptional regulator [Dethiosulfatibacter aminovorans]
MGDKLPTERQLANELNISRNTITNAYKLLEHEGVLVSYQGRGTFVDEAAHIWKRHAVQDKVLKIIDLAIDEALGSGLSAEEFLELVQTRIEEKESKMKSVNAIFIECNIEQAQVFSDQLNEVTDMNVSPVVLSELENPDDEMNRKLRNTQFAIVTYKHLKETKELLGNYNMEIMGAAINPSIESIVKMAKYPPGTKYGLISQSYEFMKKVEDALELSGIENIEIIQTISTEEQAIKEVVDKVDVVIISPGRGKKVSEIVGKSKEIINFLYFLDQESIKIIKSRLMELK